MSTPFHSVEHAVPATPLSRQAFALARGTLSDALLNHSLRTFLFAKYIAEKESNPLAADPYQLDLLFVTCICHDFGATDEHNGHERFEICGADAAVAFLEKQGISATDSHKAWVGIALHTSPGIAERIDAFTRLVRLAILVDFRQRSRDQLEMNEYFQRVVEVIPRLEIEKKLGDAVVAQALTNPEKAPAASWAGVLLRSHLEDPTWQGVNKGF